MLLGDYGSDSESENEAGPSTFPNASQSTATSSVKPASAPPTGTTPVTGANPARPKKRGGPVRITLDLPKASTSGGNDDDGETARAPDDAARSDDEEADGPNAKKPKTGSGGIKGGKGSSMLLGMLPPPKRKLPVAGASKPSLAVNKSMATTSVSRQPEAGIGGLGTGSESSGSGLMRPPALNRGKAKASSTSKDEEDDGLDLFGLGSATATSSTPPLTASSSVKPPTITSAPSVAEYVPPPPTASDPYPGYYQLPSGSWAAYDPAYYASFFPSGDLGASEDDLIARPKGQRGEDGRLGHHWDAFEGREGDVVDVYAGSGLEEARKEEERRKAMVKPKLAGDDFEYKAVGQIKGLASERHQLSSLLNTAYTQREALEERIAQNRRNARAGKAKYGF